MKYGQNLAAQSVPGWRVHNVDYNSLKNIIKVNTTKDQARAVAIPGQVDTALQKFEDQFYDELCDQHERVQLFVDLTADEISRKLKTIERDISRLLERCARSIGRPMTQKRREKFAKYDNDLIKIGELLRDLERFTSANGVAFRKILKKYQKWTGSRSLGVSFSHDVLNDPKSFSKIDFEPLNTQFTHILAILRASSPNTSGHGSGLGTPRTTSRRTSLQISSLPPPQSYWNEYDDGSEAGENEPYQIYVNSDAPFPGSKIVEFVVSHVRIPMARAKSWLSTSRSPSEERRPLIGDGTNGRYFEEAQNIFDTENEDEAYASSNEFPTGYAAHYATFPSVSDQKASRYQERMLFRACIASFGGAFVLLLIAGILVATGRRRLRVEVDAGVITSVIASLFFALMGLTCMLARSDILGWLHRICVFTTVLTLVILNGMLLVLVAGNTGL